MSKIKCITLPVTKAIGHDCGIINQALSSRKISVDAVINIQETLRWITIWYRE